MAASAIYLSDLERGMAADFRTMALSKERTNKALRKNERNMLNNIWKLKYCNGNGVFDSAAKPDVTESASSLKSHLSSIARQQQSSHLQPSGEERQHTATSGTCSYFEGVILADPTPIIHEHTRVSDDDPFFNETLRTKLNAQDQINELVKGRGRKPRQRALKLAAMIGAASGGLPVMGIDGPAGNKMGRRNTLAASTPALLANYTAERKQSGLTTVPSSPSLVTRMAQSQSSPSLPIADGLDVAAAALVQSTSSPARSVSPLLPAKVSTRRSSRHSDTSSMSGSPRSTRSFMKDSPKAKLSVYQKRKQDTLQRFSTYMSEAATPAKFNLDQARENKTSDFATDLSSSSFPSTRTGSPFAATASSGL